MKCGYHTYHSIHKALKINGFKRGRLFFGEVPRGYHTLPHPTTLTCGDKKTQAKISLRTEKMREILENGNTKPSPTSSSRFTFIDVCSGRDYSLGPTTEEVLVNTLEGKK